MYHIYKITNRLTSDFSSKTGTKLDGEHKRKIQQKLKISNPIQTQNLKRLICPNCLKIGNVGNMKRWHFDNCGKGK